MTVRWEGKRFGARLRARLTERHQLAVVIVAPEFWLASRAGLLADISIWLILGLLAGAQLATAIVYALWADVRSGWRLFIRVGVELSVIVALMYAIGWGPTLAIGLLFGAA